MGSCISKCIPRRHSQLEEFDHHHHHHHDVQDKLVISQAPTSSTTPNVIPLSNNKISPSPPSPSNSSTSSVSSFTCTTTTKYTSSSSSASSSASSVICSKDRSFSNEYLWSCYKENPHIIRINSLKESSTLSSLPAKPRKLEAAKQQRSLQKVSNWSSTTPQKRVRSRSPTLTRKKSFRKDQPERSNSTYSLHQSRSLISPSPSRRFSNINNGDKYGGVHVNNTQKESQSKRMSGTGSTTLLGSKVNTAACASGLSYSRMENLRPPTPNSSCSSSRLIGPPCLRSTRETFIHRIGSKIDEFAVGEALAHPDNVDAIPMEDIDNPLISLDCFIFL